MIRELQNVGVSIYDQRMVSVVNVMFQVKIPQLSFQIAIFKFILAATDIIYRYHARLLS